MATSLIGPFFTESASPAAPAPRLPQPTSATWMVLFAAAWTRGIATPARADAAAILPVFLMNSRREVRLWGFSFIGHIFWTAGNKCQFKKFPQAFALSVRGHDRQGENEDRAASRFSPDNNFA